MVNLRNNIILSTRLLSFIIESFSERRNFDVTSNENQSLSSVTNRMSLSKVIFAKREGDSEAQILDFRIL